MIKKTVLKQPATCVNDLLEKRERTRDLRWCLQETKDLLCQQSQPVEIDRPQHATAQEQDLQFCKLTATDVTGVKESQSEYSTGYNKPIGTYTATRSQVRNSHSWRVMKLIEGVRGERCRAYLCCARGRGWRRRPTRGAPGRPPSSATTP
jgi:hypothetical protein